MATMKDVAKLAGVSLSTTSYALNGSNKISEATRQKVLDAAKQLNFSPNAAARSLKTKKTKIIGVILSDFIGAYYSELLHGIQHKANEYGYDVIVISGIQTGERFIRQKLVDGMIMVNPAIEDDVIKDYANDELPFVLLDRQLEGEGIYNVMIHNRDAFYNIMKHHIDLGRRKIAYFGGEISATDNTHRQESYVKAIQDFNLDYQKVFQGNYIKQDAHELMKNIIKDGVDFDAVACANDLMAVGVVEALREANIKVPEEVSVSGFDNIELAAYCYPKLTTYDIDRYHWGRKASEILMRAIHHEEGIHTHVFDGHLVVRESTLK